MTGRYMLATVAHHTLGDISRDKPDLAWIDGQALADAIWESCPGGTVDALLSNLFARKASQFRVRFPQEASQ